MYLNRAFSQSTPAVLCLCLLVTLSGCSSSNSEDANPIEPDTSLQSPIPPSPSPSIEDMNPFAFSSLCFTPEVMFEIRRDAKLIDRGLLFPKDMEINLKTLGVDLIQSAEYVGSDWPTTEQNPDKELLNDFVKLGEQTLQARIDLISGREIQLMELVSQVDALSARGERFCDWVDENSSLGKSLP